MGEEQKKMIVWYLDYSMDDECGLNKSSKYSRPEADDGANDKDGRARKQSSSIWSVSIYLSIFAFVCLRISLTHTSS